MTIGLSRNGCSLLEKPVWWQKTRWDLEGLTLFRQSLYPLTQEDERKICLQGREYFICEWPLFGASQCFDNFRTMNIIGILFIPNILGVSWCCGNYCLLAFVLWCGYCSVSFQSFVLRHWCPQHQETTNILLFHLILSPQACTHSKLFSQISVIILILKPRQKTKGTGLLYTCRWVACMFQPQAVIWKAEEDWGEWNE